MNEQIEERVLPSYWQFLKIQYGRGLKSYVDATRMLDTRFGDLLYFILFSAVAYTITRSFVEFILAITTMVMIYVAILFFKDWRVLKQKGRII